MPNNDHPRGQIRKSRHGGRTARLSQGMIVDAAMRILERNGVEALTMRALAAELDCAPMALYRHVAGRNELLVALLDRMAAELPKPRLPRDPRRRLVTLLELMHDGLAQSPWIVEILVRGDLMAPSVLWLIEEILAAFSAAGLTLEQAAEAYLIAWRFTVGELIVSKQTATRTAQLDRKPFQLQLLAEVDPEQLPTLAALSSYWPKARAQSSYRSRVESLLEGLLPA